MVDDIKYKLFVDTGKKNPVINLSVLTATMTTTQLPIGESMELTPPSDDKWIVTPFMYNLGEDLHNNLGKPQVVTNDNPLKIENDKDVTMVAGWIGTKISAEEVDETEAKSRTEIFKEASKSLPALKAAVDLVAKGKEYL